MPKPSSPYVPVYFGDVIIGRAFDLGRESWAGRMTDGTRVGFHASLEATRAAILHRHTKAPCSRPVSPSVKPRSAPAP